MESRTKLSLLGTAGLTNRGDESAGLNRFPALAEAGAVLGMSGPALRKKFDRGDLPRKFLLRVGPRTLRVDLAGLLDFLRGQAGQISA